MTGVDIFDMIVGVAVGFAICGPSTCVLSELLRLVGIIGDGADAVPIG